MNAVHPRIVLSLLSVAACALPAAAQVHDPVPVGIRTESYGQANIVSLVPVPVVSVDLEHPAGPRILLERGWKGDGALLLIGTAGPAERDEVLLVGGAIVPIAGRFGRDYEFALPFDPTLPALRGRDLYVQGFRVTQIATRQAVLASAGLRISFVAGNAQPALTYTGPKLNALLAVDRCGTEARSRLLTTIDVPSGGFDLTLDHTDTQGTITRVFLTLTQPDADDAVTSPSQRLRSFKDLEGGAAPTIHVLVQTVTRGLTSPSVYELAAEVHRDF